MLYGAIALAPFKDNFWSSTNNPGNNWNVNESNPELMAVVSSLSSGPVGPSDKIDFLNITVVMQASRADGVLLRPDEPMAPLDVAFKSAFTSSLPPLQDLVFPGVWPVHTFSSRTSHHYVINALRATPLSITPADLTGVDPTAVLWSYEYYSSGAAHGAAAARGFNVRAVSATSPLVLRKVSLCYLPLHLCDSAYDLTCPLHILPLRKTRTHDTTHGAPIDFELHVLFAPAPNPKTQWTIVGEANKCVLCWLLSMRRPLCCCRCSRLTRFLACS